MKKVLALLLVLVMAVALVACKTPEKPVESDLVINACIASEPETIDPSLVSSVDGSTYTQHQFENLMKYQLVSSNAGKDPNMKATEVVLGQAKSYTVSDDKTVYTFTLRDDIYWSDGQPVTAKDWVYSWRRLVDPATAADYGYFLDGIVLNAAAIQAGEKDKTELGIEAVDDKTLKITLEAPTAYFLEMCAFASLVPLREDVVEGKDGWTEPANIVVNGPYKIVEWQHDSKIVMEKNEKYYDLAKLGPKQIVWWLSDSETAILSSYQSGEYQFIESFPSDMIKTLQDSGDCFINPYIGTYYLYLNCEKIPDWRVRAAMVISVDRDNIVNNVTQGGQSPATGFVASGILDSTGTNFAFGKSEVGAIYNTLANMYPDADLTTYAGRCALAKQLYQEAVDEGAWDPNTTIVYNFNTSDAHKAIAEACGSDWQTVLGLKITLENQEWATYTNGLGEHNFGVARLGWIADYNDPITYLELLVTGNSYNYGLYSDPNFDAAIASAKAMEASAQRDEVLYKAEETLFGEGGFPVCPVYYYTNMYCATGLTNIGYTTMGYFFFMYAQAGK
jgi:oligopeptide transport system substrate-binding protein